MQILSQVKAVNQEFVSFMSPPSVNLSPDKFDLLGQPRSRQPKRKGNTACLLVTRFIGNTELNEKPIQNSELPTKGCLPACNRYQYCFVSGKYLWFLPQ